MTQTAGATVLTATGTLTPTMFLYCPPGEEGGRLAFNPEVRKVLPTGNWYALGLITIEGVQSAAIKPLSDKDIPANILAAHGKDPNKRVFHADAA